MILVCFWPRYKTKWGNVCTLRVSSCCFLPITVHASSGTPVMLTTEMSGAESEATSIHFIRLYLIFLLSITPGRKIVQMVGPCGLPWQAQSGITISVQSCDNAPALEPCAVLLCSANSSSALSWEEYSGPALTPHSGLFVWGEGHYIYYSISLHCLQSHLHMHNIRHTHSDNSQSILSMVPQLFLQGAFAPKVCKLHSSNSCPQQIIITWK